MSSPMLSSPKRTSANTCRSNTIVDPLTRLTNENSLPGNRSTVSSGALEVGVERLLADDRGVHVPVDEQGVGEEVGAVVVIVVELGDEPRIGRVETDVEALAHREALGQVDGPGVAEGAEAAVDRRAVEAVGVREHDQVGVDVALAGEVGEQAVEELAAGSSERAR